MKKEDRLRRSGLSLVQEGQRTKPSALRDDVGGMSHERSDVDVCRFLLKILNEDVMKVCPSVISDSVHMGCEVALAEDVVWTFVKWRYLLGATSRKDTIQLKDDSFIGEQRNLLGGTMYFCDCLIGLMENV